MRLIVGLGNPGPAYALTRHNVGFRIVDAFARLHGIPIDQARYGGRYGEGSAAGLEVALLLPETFMNGSGRSVSSALRGLEHVDPARDLLIVHDDLDLPFGRLRVRASGGAGGHRGVGDIIAAVPGADLARLRFGIGRPPAGTGVVDYVLERFSPHEEASLPDSCGNACRALETVLQQGIAAALSTFNQVGEAARASS